MAKLLFYCIEVQKLSKISMIVIVNALGGQKKMTQLRRYYTIFNLMQCVLTKKSHSATRKIHFGRTVAAHPCLLLLL